MAEIVLDHVSKVYPNAESSAVSDLNLDIGDGEFIVLVGPSGCGKTTALRMVAGLESITDGTVTIGDRVVNQVPPKERDIAMVFQNYALYPHMTVYDNMGFGLKLRKVSKTDIDRRVRCAVIRRNAQLSEELRKVYVRGALVHDKTHGALGRMRAHVNDRAREAFVGHHRHGDQELPVEEAFAARFSFLSANAHAGTLTP